MLCYFLCPLKIEDVRSKLNELDMDTMEETFGLAIFALLNPCFYGTDVEVWWKELH